MKKLIVATVFWFATAVTAAASCTGQFPGGSGCWNNGTSTNNPGPTASPVLGVPGLVGGALTFSGATSGQALLRSQSVAGTPTITLPTGSGTVAVTASAPLSLDPVTGALTCSGCGGAGGQALTASNDTNVTLTLGGTPATALLNASSITAGWAGQLAGGRGGTGLNSASTGPGVLQQASSGSVFTVGSVPLSMLPLGSSGQALVGNGASAPSYQAVVNSFNSRTGAVTPQTGDYTATQVGLGNVTNDTQTKAAVVPNTLPTSGQLLIGNTGGTAYGVVSLSGDCTLTNLGAITCTKTSGTAFGVFATGTNAANLTGTVNTAQLPSPFTSGTISGNTSTFATASGTLTNGHCVSIDASGNFVDAGGACTVGGGGGTVNAGTAGQLSYYATSTNAVSGNANVTVSAGALMVGQAGSQAGTLKLSGSTSGTTTIGVAATASGTLTLPAATDTLVGRATTDTLTNKTYNTAGTGNVFSINGTQITAISGNTATVGSTSGALTNGHCAKFDASGNIVDNGASCGSAPGGANTNIQFNNTGIFGGSSAFVWDGTGATIGASGTLGYLQLGNGTSGLIRLQPVTGALGTPTLLFPAASDTLVARNTTDTLTNKTISGSSNTLSSIGNASLTNSSMTLAGHTVSLGGTQTFAAADLSNGTTGSGAVVLATSPTLVTPTLGAASATTINKVTLTAPASGSTLTVADGKTLTASNSITLAGTDGTTWTGPGVNATVAALNIADQTLTGGANVISLGLSTGNITVDCGARALQYIANTGAFTVTAPASDGSCYVQLENGSGAGAVTFSGFSVGANVGDSLDTVSGHKFLLAVARVHSISTYSIKALQ